MNNRNQILLLRLAKSIALALLALGFASCSTTKNLDLSTYPKIPDTPTSAVYRLAAKSNPITAKAAFYGNYGGSGNSGGKPIDQMDEQFRRHDLAYFYLRTLRPMIQADDELVQNLKEIDLDSLSPEGRKFRKRTIKFFTSPSSHVIGKPISAFFRTKEHPDSSTANSETLQQSSPPEKSRPHQRKLKRKR